LLALNLLEGFDLKSFSPYSHTHLHLLLESLRLSLSDTYYYVSDPNFSNIPIEQLLSKKYSHERRSLISLDKAIPHVERGHPIMSSDTVYLAVVDGEGNACSLINSNYEGFGTGIVPRGCGFTLQNRGHNFSLDKEHPNSLQPGKRPFHTIIPGLAIKDNSLYACFGVMGGWMQPQGHVQVLLNLIDFGMNPQQAVDAPRLFISPKGEISCEEGIPEEVIRKLKEMGHNIEFETVKAAKRNLFGRSQIILRNPKTGVLCGGSDPRADGCAIGFC